MSPSIVNGLRFRIHLLRIIMHCPRYRPTSKKLRCYITGYLVASGLGPYTVWFSVGNGGMDPYSIPKTNPNNSSHDPCPHSLLSTGQYRIASVFRLLGFRATKFGSLFKASCVSTQLEFMTSSCSLPPAYQDADCKNVAGCVRCAHSGYCTDQPISVVV